MSNQYTGHVPCSYCGKSHWMHDSCEVAGKATEAGYDEPQMKVSDALPEMLLAMDAMWGAINAAEEVLETLIDCNDGRLLTMRGALRKAAGHLEPLMRHTTRISDRANHPRLYEREN